MMTVAFLAPTIHKFDWYILLSDTIILDHSHYDEPR